MRRGQTEWASVVSAKYISTYVNDNIKFENS